MRAASSWSTMASTPGPWLRISGIGRSRTRRATPKWTPNASMASGRIDWKPGCSNLDWAVWRPITLLGRHQFDFEFAPDRGSSALHGVELHLVVIGIQKPDNLRPAGVHPAGHLGFGNPLLLHRLFDLPGEHALDRVGGHLVVNALFF